MLVGCGCPPAEDFGSRGLKIKGGSFRTEKMRNFFKWSQEAKGQQCLVGICTENGTMTQFYDLTRVAGY